MTVSRQGTRLESIGNAVDQLGSVGIITYGMRVEEQYFHCWRYRDHFDNVSLDGLDDVHVALLWLVVLVLVK